MSKFWWGNLFLLASMLCAVASQIMIKTLLDEFQAVAEGWPGLHAMLSDGRPIRAVIASALLVTGFGFWILCLTKLDLSYAYPVACSSVLIVAFFSAFSLGEAVTPRVWLGTVLILLGLVALGPAR
jgi:drug/metabolite transporter (DMT)-like permease